MQPQSWLAKTPGVLGLALLFLATVNTAGAKPRKVPLGTVRAELRDLFTAWDLDADGYLDKEELAKAFRGPDARPYDYKKPAKPKKDDKEAKDKDDKEDKDKKDARDKKDDAKDKKDDKDKKDGAKDKKDDARDKKDDKDKSSSKSTDKPDYSSYPDYQFLMLLDTNGDGKISKAEWNAWAKDYSVQLKTSLDIQLQLLDLQQKIQDANARYVAAKNDAARRKAYAAYQRLRREALALDKKMRAMKPADKKLLKALKAKK